MDFDLNVFCLKQLISKANFPAFALSPNHWSLSISWCLPALASPQMLGRKKEDLKLKHSALLFGAQFQYNSQLVVG